jgi:hypothetical protein
MGETGDKASADAGRRTHLGEIAEDASGFGISDLRLTRDLLLRPAQVMAAYDELGSTGGGRYPRPLRYYFILNGVLLLVFGLTGGLDKTLSVMPPEIVDPLLKMSGKSRDSFLSDFDQWSGMLSIPTVTVILAAALYQVIKRWSPRDSRTDFHQTFSFLNLWTLYQFPAAVLTQLYPQQFGLWSAPYMLATAAVSFGLLGRDRWWFSRRGAIGKGVLLLLLIVVLMIPAALATYGLGLAAAVYLP